MPKTINRSDVHHELGMQFYQSLKLISSGYPEEEVKACEHIRREIFNKTKAKCLNDSPNCTEDDWKKAINIVAHII